MWLPDIVAQEAESDRENEEPGEQYGDLLGAITMVAEEDPGVLIG